MDKTTQNLAATPEGRSALVLAEVQKLPGGCGGEDPEDPRCAKVRDRGPTHRKTESLEGVQPSDCV
jgi:hypothetical protein